ncbi:LPS export ABC transporter periplasmic protein LptC [Endomicrobium proavitum]|uniref:Lipopolysaccharide-assembly, LptC-related n=1 Tax=Endomicrobium proavitum TaxID=1408281 RepID=A0A0G3WFS7_9BACT|nr:LPS export ABC transporter periplasmic protein LptC [Endomicrobium proavitum]AKL97461.1 Lipopolysaccharide-assembly, LptC-related [Endomicrobium proavitum]
MRILRYERILFVFAALICVALASCKSEKTIIEETPPMTEQAVEKFTITETEAGKVKMVLESESAIINEDTQKAFLRLPRVKFYQDGKYASTLITESADINLETYDIAGHGKCTIDTVNNEHLQTTNLGYDAKKKIVFSKTDVTLTRDGDTVYGKGFEADTKLDKIVIKKQKIIINKNN